MMINIFRLQRERIIINLMEKEEKEKYKKRGELGLFNPLIPNPGEIDGFC